MESHEDLAIQYGFAFIDEYRNLKSRCENLERGMRYASSSLFLHKRDRMRERRMFEEILGLRNERV